MSEVKPFVIKLSNGITVSGTTTARKWIDMFRDPSNLNSVVQDIPAGTAVAIVLPVGEVELTEFGE